MEKLADLHVHTNRGDGVLTVSQVLRQSRQLGLSAVAITDHDQVAPRVLASGLEVIRGAEITTAGFRHVLGLYLEKDIKPGQKLAETIKQVHQAGGLAVAAHPLVPFWPASLTAKDILDILNGSDREVYWDGFEIGRIWPERARKFFDQHLKDKNIAEVGGTDAHFRSVGQVVTVYDGDLKEAIIARKTRVAVTGRKEIANPSDFLLNFFRAMVVEPWRRGRLWF